MTGSGQDDEPDFAEIEDARAEYAEKVHRAYQARDLAPGMSMRQVRTIWGSPADIESAGDPGDGNQRWVYYEGFSTRRSVNRARVVYFEDGQVIGWETTGNPNGRRPASLSR